MGLLQKGESRASEEAFLANQENINYKEDIMFLTKETERLN